MKKINEMKRKDFEKLKHRKWDEKIVFDSMIIIPGLSRDLHDSGYRAMDFVAVKGDKPICLLSGCSDVIHFDGIGGFGNMWFEKYGTVPKTIPPSGWEIDCLPKSGFLRIWSTRGKMTVGSALSSFDIFVVEKEKP